MKLPSLSSSMYVARLRYIQSIHEPLDRRNPDTLVGHFIPFLERCRARWLGRENLRRLRAEPFYYYLLARTKCYDQVLNDAVAGGVRRIAMVGCGTDTRAYRFERLLRSKGVKVLECDQPAAISVKEQMAKRWQPSDYVEYLPIDLNDQAWPRFERWLGGPTSSRTLVLLEGVSGYINDGNFRHFLQVLASNLSPGSHLAYDFKLRGVQDELGRVGRTRIPFRLSPARDEVMAFHKAFGLRLEWMELSSELCARLLPDAAKSGLSLFGEDALVKAQVFVA